MGFYWILSDTTCPQVFKTFPNFQTDLNSGVIWMALIFQAFGNGSRCAYYNRYPPLPAYSTVFFFVFFFLFFVFFYSVKVQLYVNFFDNFCFYSVGHQTGNIC